MAKDPNAATAKECKVKLKSSDGKLFEVEHAVALESQMVKNMIEDTGTESAVPLLNVSSEILTKVIEYCEYHVHAAKTSEEKSAISEEDVKTWDQEFVKLDQPTLFNLMMAAEYLGIKNLQDLTCQTVADMIAEKTPNEIRMILNLKNDYSPEEEEEIRRENQWAFE